MIEWLNNACNPANLSAAVHGLVAVTKHILQCLF